jgi:hypothetical protein
MSAFDDFNIAMACEGANLIAGMQESDHARVRYSVSRHLGHADGEPPPEPRQLDPHEAAVERLFSEFAEILESVKSLRNIPVYISSFPYRHAGIENGAYLRYHIENYLHELYILRERMKKYLTVISRLFKADSRSCEISTANEALRNYVFTVLTKDFVNARGGHVHEKRLTFSDEDFVKLGTFEAIRDMNQVNARLYERVYREVLKAKRDWIKRTNESIEFLLDTYFGSLHNLLFDEEGRLRIPTAPKK